VLEVRMMFTRRRGPVLVLVIALLVPLSASAQAKPTGTATSVAGATSVTQLADAAKTLEAIQLSFREIAKKVLPVVVKIDVTEVVKVPSATTTARAVRLRPRTSR
jgi:S1-C subfamily serine protease